MGMTISQHALGILLTLVTAAAIAATIHYSAAHFSPAGGKNTWTSAIVFGLLFAFFTYGFRQWYIMLLVLLVLLLYYRMGIVNAIVSTLIVTVFGFGFLGILNWILGAVS